MFSDPMTLPYTAFALGCAIVAAGLLLWYLVARPALGRTTKIALLLGIGILPLGTAANGNVAGFHATMTRTFCSSCHVMTPFGDDVANPHSTSLAARHGRNEEFGGEACYTCHADYGMFETVVTKLGGMRHESGIQGRAGQSGVDDRPEDGQGTSRRVETGHETTKIGAHGVTVEDLRSCRNPVMA